MEWSLLVSTRLPKTQAKSQISPAPSAASELSLCGKLHHPRPGLFPIAASQAHGISLHSVLTYEPCWLKSLPLPDFIDISPTQKPRMLTYQLAC